MKNNQLQKNIPNGWQIKKLGDVTKVVAGFGFPVRFQGKKIGKYPFAKVSDMNRLGNEKYISYAENYLDEEDLKRVKVKTYPIGTVIFPKVGAALLTNKRRILNTEALIDNNIMGLIPEKITSEYLYYWMLRFDVTQHVGQGALPSINQSYVEQLELLLPPKTEQEKIADILSKVDEDIEKTKKIIEEAERLKKGLMKDFLIKGKKIQIKDISEINPEQIIPKEEIEYSYIDIASIDDFQVNNPKSFLGKNAPSRARRLVKTNDIIISTVRPNLKAFSYIKSDYNNFLCSTGFCVLRINNKLANSKYLYYSILQDNFVEYLVGKTTGSNYPAVSSSDIGEYVLNLPSLDEQEKTAEILSAVDEKISINKKLKEKLTHLKKGLMSDLLSGKVRV